ncbi:binding-protein-dependent transport systems inner membrane component [Xylanimonas cellulosilytica DSM 15894]|uniref:Binding-protein-dependent transport systems inner membrane component n=1 Tax=Xylanimonas cellulosilytica (strain DSM 15894 / JCM 12276 / CECT 5975 / KCTC 9989 / LMG 20990 / NBRC 107835 / XIL07) TaxID=446471 RepID=D1BVX1_XYLCX|nr:ABC transporter permease [Xylanimonas cellulosilytica]ACZ29474.1 binding-protein-dependent transport systems inner membrane component [Xylanimonas cellulosilytica DSM 15894]
MTATITAPGATSLRTSARPTTTADVRPAARTRLRLGRPIKGAGLLGVTALALIWVVGAATGFIDPRVLSAPWTVVTTGADLIADGRLQENLLVSLHRSALGLFFGVSIGLVLALIAGLSRLGDALLDGPIQVKRSIPNLALLPLLILWFGIGEEMKVITIAIGVFLPIYIHTHNGLRSIDARFVELAETVSLPRAQFIRRVVLPGALPGFLLGLRFAVTGSMLALVVVEQVNATAGIGYMMELARTYGQTDVIVVGLVVYGVLGFSADSAVRLLQRRALSWRKTLED